MPHNILFPLLPIVEKRKKAGLLAISRFVLVCRNVEKAKKWEKVEKLSKAATTACNSLQ